MGIYNRKNISAAFIFASVLEDKEKSIATEIYLVGKKLPYNCRQWFFPCHGSTYNGHWQTHTHELRLQIRLKYMVREGSWIPERMRIIGHAYARTSASFQGASVTPRMENPHGCCVLTSSLRNKSLWHQFMGELSRTNQKFYKSVLYLTPGPGITWTGTQ